MEPIETHGQSQDGQEQPLACRRDAGAFTTQQRQRHEEIGQQMREALEEVRELPDGYAFGFPYDAQFMVTLAQFMGLERLCCPFLHFTLELPPGEGPLWLHLKGGPRVKELLVAEFAEMDPASR